MKDYIEERAIGIAGYIIDHNATVRQTAKAFGISKSTVHKDVTGRTGYQRKISPSALDVRAGNSFCTGKYLEMADDTLYNECISRITFVR